MDKHQITIDTFNKYALCYQDRFMGSDLYAATYDKLLELIDKPNADVLDLACGPGNIARYLLDRRSGLNILGVDLAPKMVELATANCPEADFVVMDCREPAKLESVKPESGYDVLVSGFSTPYLSRKECDQLLANAGSLMRSSGIFYLSTMEGNYEDSGPKISSEGDSVYTYYHSADHLTAMLTACGFKVVELLRQDYPEQDGSTTVDLFILARKL